jgi:hypothetical protein
VPGSPSDGSGLPLLLILCAAILGTFWFFLARRRRRRPEPALATAAISPPGGKGPIRPTAVIPPPRPVKDKKAKAPKVNNPKVEPVFAESFGPSAAAIRPAPSAALDEPFGEALMPRWRRPSLKTARYASPTVAPAPVAALTFAGGATSGLERRRVRYDLVAMTDIPDEIRGGQVGQLQANDEVEITGRQGAWVKVRTPVGAEGWIHRTTLRATDDTAERATVAPPVVEAVKAPPPPNSIEAEVAMGAFAAAARARALEVAQAAAVSEPPARARPRSVPGQRAPRPQGGRSPRSSE